VHAYTTGGVSDWDALLRGLFAPVNGALGRDAQVLLDLGLIHREGEWQHYWSGWLDWMRVQGPGVGGGRPILSSVNVVGPKSGVASLSNPTLPRITAVAARGAPLRAARGFATRPRLRPSYTTSRDTTADRQPGQGWPDAPLGTLRRVTPSDPR
jgi:hypothetical protein